MGQSFGCFRVLFQSHLMVFYACFVPLLYLLHLISTCCSSDFFEFSTIPCRLHVFRLDWFSTAGSRFLQFSETRVMLLGQDVDEVDPSQLPQYASKIVTPEVKNNSRCCPGRGSGNSFSFHPLFVARSQCSCFSLCSEP